MSEQSSESPFTQSPIQVVASPTFARNIRKLSKKYRSIREDVEPVIKQLAQGELPGSQIADIGYTVFKLRIQNTDIQRGKSGGYRLIYYVKTETQILLLTIYPKSEQADITANEIKQIIEEK
jgi:mRNA-degrading endonuclease RelE of RelBE toxin-antitoxin system